MSYERQKAQILNWLKLHGSITSWEAIQEFRITRLSSYICTLKNEGQKIVPIWETDGVKRWVRYNYVP